MKIGIRKETQYPSEKRAALTPEHVKNIIANNLNVIVQPAEDQRIFKKEDYINVGAEISNDLKDCDIIFGVKEVPIDDLIPNKPFVFFSHTIKGQNYNMPLLKAILDKNITLMDYELVKDNSGKRIIFFGKFAGYAGIIDSLWLLGRRYTYEGIDTPFRSIKQATNYKLLVDAQNAITEVGNIIRSNGLPDNILPFVTGFTGYGNVSKGAQELYDLLPSKEIKVADFKSFVESGNYTNKEVYKIEFSEADMYENTTGAKFDLNHFMKEPNLYKSLMYNYLPHLSMLINGIYWEERFPKHVTKILMKEYYENNPDQKLKVIGDITCDINGSVELTVKSTPSDNPAYVYEPLSDNIIDGVNGNGPVILAVDKLPAELPVQASKMFGDALLPYVKDLASADYSKDYENLDIPKEFKDAVIAHKGKLTPQFEYLSKYLS